MAMDKVVISILGRDRPGIVASVAEILLDKGCNIEDVTQTSLQAEFAGIFIATIPDSLAPSTLLSFLKSGLAPLGLEVLVKRLERGPDHYTEVNAAPFARGVGRGQGSPEDKSQKRPGRETGNERKIPWPEADYFVLPSISHLLFCSIPGFSSHNDSCKPSYTPKRLRG
jgi:predicted amino acid-binding ACT domain protein